TRRPPCFTLFPYTTLFRSFHKDLSGFQNLTGLVINPQSGFELKLARATKGCFSDCYDLVFETEFYFMHGLQIRNRERDCFVPRNDELITKKSALLRPIYNFH